MTRNPTDILSQFRLDNRIALVTGSATGLGAAIAHALSQAGAAVAVHGNSRPADETAAAIAARRRRCSTPSRPTSPTPPPLSASSAPSSRNLAASTSSSTTPAPSTATQPRIGSSKTGSASCRVNLTSVFQLSQLAARDMIARNAPGKVVSIASLLQLPGRHPRAGCYAASKGGVAQLTKALANEWAPRNIQVNAIAPGCFATT